MKYLRKLIVKSMVLIFCITGLFSLLAGCGSEEFDGLTIITSFSSEKENEPLQKIANLFTEETGIAVKLGYKPESGGYDAWLQTQFASGRAPDIIMATRDRADRAAINEYLYDLTDALNTPNEYFEDKSCKTWKDTFIDSSIDRSAYSLDSSKHYIIPATMVSVRIVINLDYLDQHNIPHPSRDWTWNEYMEICEKVQATGMPVFDCANARSIDGPVNWTVDLLANMLLPDLVDQWDLDGNRNISANEMVKIILEGDLKLNDPRIADLYGYIEQWKKYWNPGFNSTDITTAQHTFCKQEAWSYMNGSWSAQSTEMILDNAFGDAHQYERFNYMSMPFPRITQENNPNATYKKIPEIGDVGYAFSVTSLAEQRGHAEDAIRFLKFLNTRTQIETWFDTQWNLPAIKGASMSPKTKEFDWVENSEAYPLRLTGATLPDTTILDRYFNQLQLFLVEKMSKEELCDRLQTMYFDFVTDIADQYGWDESNGYGTSN